MKMNITFKKFTVTRTQDVYVKIDPGGKDGFQTEENAEDEAFNFAAGNIDPETINWLARGECGEPFECSDKENVEAGEAKGYFDSSKVARNRALTDKDIAKAIRNVDWDLLQDQKFGVLVKRNHCPVALREGLVNFIDALQDIAENHGLWDYEKWQKKRGVSG